MKIGILSDTHNDSSTLKGALQAFRQRGVRTLFHCGDLTTDEMLQRLDGFQVYLVRGNMDRHQALALETTAATQEGATWLGSGDEIRLAGKRIAITHGDRRDLFDTLLNTGPDYLFTGHTHRRRDERVGSTRVINPGALGGIRHEARSVCVLDLETDQLQVVCL